MIIQKYLTQNDCYKQGRVMKIRGIMLHSVGCSVEEPMRFIKSWDKSGIEKCVHAFIGRSDVYETLPHNYRGWHCGRGKNGSYNDGYIGIEMCEPRTIRYTNGSNYVDINRSYTRDFVSATYDQAVSYFAYLCKKYALNPLGDRVIVSHSEANRLGYASNHGDVEHIWNYVGISMDRFRHDVYDATIEDKDNKQKEKIKSVKNDIIIEKMRVNGKYESIHTIKDDNYNYVRLDDLKKLGLDVNYDKNTKMISINL